MSKYQCSFHKEYITNFCAIPECIKPLCPECVSEHLQEHRNPNIQSLKSVKQQVLKKLDDCLQNCLKETNQISFTQVSEQMQQMIEEEAKRIVQCKDQIIQRVNLYFNEVLKLFKEKCQIQGGKLQEMQVQQQKIQKILNDLKQFQAAIEKDQQMETLVTACHLDSMEVIKCIKKEMKTLQKLQPHIKVEYNNSFNQLDDILRVACSIAQEEQSFQPGYMISENTANDQFKRPMSQNPSFHQPPEKKEFKFEIDQTLRQSIIVQNNVSHFLNFVYQNPNQKPHICQITYNQEKKQLHYPLNFLENIKFHQLTTLKTGQIFLTGGTIGDQRSKNIWQIVVEGDECYEQQKKSMNKARSSHAACAFEFSVSLRKSNNLIVVGGIDQDKNILHSVELFDTNQDDWEELADLKVPVCQASICSFNSTWIYCFGGRTKEKGSNQMVNLIQRMNYEKKGDWEIISSTEPKIKISELTTTGFFQINPKELIILGGYDTNKSSSADAYILSFTDDRLTNVKKKANALLKSGGFEGNAFGFDFENFYVLQDSPSFDKRNLLRLNGSIIEEMRESNQI